MSKSSSFAKIDIWDLCKSKVRTIEGIASGRNLLNQAQCRDLSAKLSKSTQNIQQLVVYCGASSVLFRPALENLYRYLEKARVLVSSCAEKDWCAAAVFQCQNENAFREILLDVSLCYNVVYEHAKSNSRDWNDPPEDLRQSSVFLPATDSDVHGDQEDLQKRLDDLANGHSSVKWKDHLIPGRVARKQSLAGYLLTKMCYTPLEPQASNLDAYSAILWRKASEPLGTWGNSGFLGSGSGASGVCSTTWLGIPCAKKEFHGQEIESLFLKEAGILAHLKHPCIVNFVCCGNGLERGDRFLAMELMEKSLFELIEEQKGDCLSLRVAVDMMVQMARGVCYLHSRGVAHRDLKPQNVVVSRLSSPHRLDHFCVKLVDFGMSKIKVEVSKANTMTASGIGTTMYRAPEAHPMANPDGEGKVDWFRADAFSFAMTCAHLLSLEVPFKGLKASELYNELSKNARRPNLPSTCPEDLVELLGDCWKTKPASRPSFVGICRRLEIFSHKLLRGYSTLDEGVHRGRIDFGGGLSFIETKMKEIVVGDDLEVKTFGLQVPNLPCNCGSALELLHQPPYDYRRCCCDMCWGDIYGVDYRCDACDFDAHPDCVEIREEMEVFFHGHPLHLLVRNYYQDNEDAICYICKELLQHSDWVYTCEECKIDVHALCAKYPREKMTKHVHPHRLTLTEYLPEKSLACKCCSGEVRTNTWSYTCIQKWCPFDLHPYCSIQPFNPLCIFDGSHRLRQVRDQRGFHCSRCGALGFSLCYHCRDCDVDIHLDCLHDMDEVEDGWNEACERFMVEYATKDDHGKVNMISDLLEKLPGGDALQASLSSTSSPPAGTMRIKPIIRRRVALSPFAAIYPFAASTIGRLASSEKLSLDAFDDSDLRRKTVAETAKRKGKRIAEKGERHKLKAKCALKMFGTLGRMVLDLQCSKSVSQADAEVLASTLEMLEKQKYNVEEEMATLVQSKMRHGPRTCLFFQDNKDRGVYELLASLAVDMQDVCLMFLCEEPGHQHVVPGSYIWRFRKALGEEPSDRLQPLLASGLQVVSRALSTSAEQLTQVDRVTLQNLGPLEWDLRAIDLEKHGRLLEDKENVVELKMAEVSAAEWVLDLFEEQGCNIFKLRGLIRVRYKETEEGDSPGYTRGSLAWLCVDHVNRGLKSGILQSYPVKYLNPELN